MCMLKADQLIKYFVRAENTFIFWAQNVQLSSNDSMKYENDLPCEQATQVPSTKHNYTT